MNESPPSRAGASSRRALLSAAAGAAGGALALGACGSTQNNHVKSDAKPPPADVALLGTLLDLEQKTIAAYEAGIPLLDPVSSHIAQQFLRQELAHAGEIGGLIKKAGATPAPPGLYSLGHPRTAQDVLALLHHLESAQLSGYLSALPRLSGGPVRAALAAVFANDAQHVTVLRTLLHGAPAPAAFVTGRE